MEEIKKDHYGLSKADFTKCCQQDVTCFNISLSITLSDGIKNRVFATPLFIRRQITAKTPERYFTIIGKYNDFLTHIVKEIRNHCIHSEIENRRVMMIKLDNFPGKIN